MPYKINGGTYPDSCDPIIILADRLGNIIKYVKLEKPDPINTFEALLDLKEDSENNIYATGRISVNTLYNRGLIIKFNPKGGNHLEERIYRVRIMELH